MINAFLFLMSGAVLPFILWPVEYLLPYPYVVEEFAKYLCLAWLSRNKIKTKFRLLAVIGYGLLFTLTESVLYIFNLLAIGRLDLFFTRLVLTSVLHITTVLIIDFGLGKPRVFQLLTVVLAIMIHYLFNLSVLGWL